MSEVASAILLTGSIGSVLILQVISTILTIVVRNGGRRSR